jgi:hypothetical protein
MCAALTGLALTACGSSGHTTASVTAPGVTNPSSSAKSPLAPFLLARGEEMGFPPDAHATNYTSAKNWAAFSESPGGAGRLRSEGFIDAVIESLGEGSGGSGDSNVTEFSHVAGARSEATAQLRAFIAGQPTGSTKSFAVSGVPSAHGVVVDLSGTVDTNVFWVEGRCTMILGNSAGVSLQSRVRAGVQAIVRRTHGSCP